MTIGNKVKEIHCIDCKIRHLKHTKFTTRPEEMILYEGKVNNRG